MVNERLVDVSDFGVIGAPRIDRETVFLGEKFLEELHVLGLETDIRHALEPNILVQPDRPA